AQPKGADLNPAGADVGFTSRRDADHPPTQRTGSRGELGSERVPHVDHAHLRLKLQEQPRLGLSVSLYARVVVQVVLGQVREDSHAEMNGVRAALLQRVARDLHHEGAGPRAGRLREVAADGVGLRRGQGRVDAVIPEVVAQGTQARAAEAGQL